mgnify:CR=1 FL=1
MADFARAKGLLDTAFRQRNADSLRELPAQFEQMAASVSVIDRPVLVQALQGIAALARHAHLVTGGPDTEAAQGFALLCTRTELAMEALRDGLFGDADVLPELDATVQTLKEQLSVDVDVSVTVPSATTTNAPSLPDDLDGEMRDVFLEEANDVLVSLEEERERTATLEETLQREREQHLTQANEQRTQADELRAQLEEASRKLKAVHSVQEG